MFANFIILPLIASLIIFIILAVRDGQHNNMNNQHNAKYAFYYLLSLVALVFMSVSVGMIAFSIIDKTVVDVLNGFAGTNDSQLKFAISALFIAGPIFYIISRLIYRGLRRQELDKDSSLRRWLTYFILFVSSMVILGVFIGVINNFLSGELTARFILKAVTVFVISAAVFSFYLYDVKRTAFNRSDLIARIFSLASLAVVIAAFVASWFFVEAPKTARARRLDDIVINNIYNIENAVNVYYDRYEKLPADLEVLKSDSNVYLDLAALSDPETKQAIVYRQLGDQSFELCANFRLDSERDSAKERAVPSYAGGSKDHRAGYYCLPGTLWSPEKAIIN